MGTLFRNTSKRHFGQKSLALKSIGAILKYLLLVVVAVSYYYYYYYYYYYHHQFMLLIRLLDSTDQFSQATPISTDSPRYSRTLLILL